MLCHAKPQVSAYFTSEQSEQILPFVFVDHLGIKGSYPPLYIDHINQHRKSNLDLVFKYYQLRNDCYFLKLHIEHVKL